MCDTTRGLKLFDLSHEIKFDGAWRWKKGKEIWKLHWSKIISVCMCMCMCGYVNPLANREMPVYALFLQPSFFLYCAIYVHIIWRRFMIDTGWPGRMRSSESPELALKSANSLSKNLDECSSASGIELVGGAKVDCTTRLSIYIHSTCQ